MEIKCYLERGFNVVVQESQAGKYRRCYDLSLQIPGLDSWQRTHNSFSACAYHPDIQWAYLTYEVSVFKLNLRTGVFQKVYDTGDPLHEVKSIDISNHGTYVKAMTQYGVVVLDTQSDKIVFSMGTKGVAPISFDEKLIALAGEQSIHVFELPSGELLYKKKRIQIRQCCFDDSGEYLIYSTDTNEVLLWDYKPFITTSIYQAEAPILKLAMNRRFLEITFIDGSEKFIPVLPHK